MVLRCINLLISLHDILTPMSVNLSIVIPTKNEETYLPQLLQSIKQQTLQPSEIIIADADSTDNTVDLARSYGAQVVKGGMPSVGRNRGAQAAHGDMILFLDADVVLQDETFLAEAIKDFTKKDLDIATVDVSPIDGTSFDRFAHRFYNKYVRLLGRLHPHAPGFCIFVKKELHQKLHGFDEEIIFCEDHDYVYRANKIARFGFLTKELVIPVSTRRLERDGRMVISMKYILAELHILFLGPIKHDFFNYQFGHKQQR